MRSSFKIRYATPFALGWNLLSVGPSFTITSLTTKLSPFNPWLLTAFATAEFNSFMKKYEAFYLYFVK